MFGSKTRRIRELETRLGATERRLERVQGELTTHQTNARIALQRRDQADTRTASLRRELVAAQSRARRLEERLADLQAANESAYTELAARAGTTPAPVDDHEADTAALIGGAR